VKVLEKIGDRRVHLYLIGAFEIIDEEESLQDSLAAGEALRRSKDPEIVGLLLFGLLSKPLFVNTLYELTYLTGEVQGPTDLTDPQMDVFKRWVAWYGKAGKFLKWDEKEQKYTVDEAAKESGVPYLGWSRISEETKSKWENLNEQEREAVRTQVANEFMKERALEDKAWAAGVRVEWWKEIPEDSRKSWDTLSKEEHERLIADAQKKILEQEKPATPPEPPPSGEEAPTPSGPAGTN
jgi:hypothetical protein